MITMPRCTGAVALATATLILTAACSTEKQENSPKADRTASAQQDLAGNTPGTGPDAPAGQLTIANDPKIGPIVTDATGFTLYRFTKDTQEPLASACEGDCATLWPPVPAKDASLPQGLEPTLLGSLKRPDGIAQLTVAGIPVYRYAKDTKPGQANGQGVGGTWFASLPEEGVPGFESVLAAITGGVSDDGAGEAGDAADAALPGMSVVDNPKLGKILVDGQGRTLYRFVKDTDWPMTTACTGKCLDTWKPAKVIEKNDVNGIDPKLVIPFNRPDGVLQQTIDCWPLYWFTGDKTPGDTNGQGVDGYWFAAAADGSLVK
ncbi:SCO0930 family lipoprotein [Streptomyces sp. NBC_00568]|uniref:SCO0930 family lipoprotein n=1 Tax=Streptomyces sp. NBC_00568 TaxID=2975779 RepID=UPI0022511B95|nr:SCO0930 family lipoprotein [Streptomyces sp. NBC_00568]MCX4993633.1 SCO0930 family lipoprotein [Streptomyces sp. NBC_00568]